jgi:hypothetical protein
MRGGSAKGYDQVDRTLGEHCEKIIDHRRVSHVLAETGRFEGSFIRVDWLRRQARQIFAKPIGGRGE